MTHETTPNAGAAALLEARGLHKSYLSGERRLQVLRGVELAVAAGESVSIRGESGSGKSTLLNLLSGLDIPDAGELRWEGDTTLSAARRGRLIGLVFQSFYLVPELDALDNVLLAARLLGPIGPAERARATMASRKRCLRCCSCSSSPGSCSSSDLSCRSKRLSCR